MNGDLQRKSKNKIDQEGKKEWRSKNNARFQGEVNLKIRRRIFTYEAKKNMQSKIKGEFFLISILKKKIKLKERMQLKKLQRKIE